MATSHGISILDKDCRDVFHAHCMSAVPVSPPSLTDLIYILQVAKLRAYHYTAQTKPEKAGLSRYGLDLIKGTLRNNVEAGVLEPVLSKLKIIQVGSQVYLEGHRLVPTPQRTAHGPHQLSLTHVLAYLRVKSNSLPRQATLY